MSPASLVRRCLVLAALLAIVLAGPASAEPTGGAAAPGPPEVAEAACGDGEDACRPGEVLRVEGASLQRTDAVVFLGGPRRWNDRRAVPRSRDEDTVTVRVPRTARTGPVVVRSRGIRSAPTPEAVEVARPTLAGPPPTAPRAPSGAARAFPIRGAHDYGTRTNRFGGGRGHGGQDVFAECGTPLVAALGGVVTAVRFQARAGNYAVITADDGTSQAYMHLRSPSPLVKGQRVEAGQPIGEVGDTGRATGCHLHFELWTAPGWYQGGTAVDPLAFLRDLEGAG